MDLPKPNRERPPPRPPWTVLTHNSEPDPLDIEFYGLENAPLPENSYSYTRTYDDKDVWRSFRKDSNHHSIAADSDKKSVARDDSSVNKSPAKSKSSEKNSQSSHRKTAAANAARQAAIDSSRQSVNPYAVYKENLARITNDAIRLIHLPSNDNTLELKVFPLKHAPKYAALSYSWGDCSLVTSLSIKPPLPITTELGEALNTFASSGKYEWIWVDAVSINQAHPEEKSHQVQQMRKIYERAEVVYIWLGSHIEEVYSSPPTTRPPSRSSASRSSDDQPNREDIVRNFLRVLDHHNSGTVWWTRLWTIQELVSAVRPVICFGPFIVTWDEFVSAVIKLDDHRDLLEEEVPDWHSRSTRYLGQLQGARDRVKQLYDLRKHLRSSPGGEEILDLLRFTSTANSSNPRDKVYGVLGLATRRDQTGIAIDYGLSVARVFAQTALHIIRSKASLDVVVDQWNRTCGVPYDREAPKSLPSWVPNFSRPVRHVPTSTARIKKYNASGASLPCVNMTHSLKLSIEAVYFDEIEETMVKCIDEAEPGYELDTFRLITLPSLETLVAPALRRKLSPNDWRSRLCKDESLARTLVLDQHDGLGTPEPQTFQRVIDIMERTSGEECSVLEEMLDQEIPLGRQQAYECLQRASQVMHKRALFVTHFGFVGVGPKALEKGDIIVVPLGASVPFVLRKTDRQGKYTLVVDCFVHGIMYGEAIKSLDNNETTTDNFQLI